MTNEQIEQMVSGREPEMHQVIKAFIKATQSKDFKTMKSMAVARWFIGKCEKWRIQALKRYGYKRTLRIIENVDYLWWETKALRELLND